MRKLALFLLILTLTATPAAAQDDDGITLIPFEDDIYQISGVIPDGWNEVAPGILARGDSPTDSSFAQLAQQAAPVPPDALLEAILPQLGLEEPPPAVGERETDHLTWTLYQAEASNEAFSAVIDIALAESDNTTYLVLLVALPETYDALHESVFLPVVDAFAPLAEEAPTDYLTEEVEIENGDVTLAGTLSLPPGDGPHPAVILISGTGPQDRDELLGVIKPFRLIADYLTPLGIAVLRYDDRGVGGSTGDFDAATMAEFVTDGAAALAFLRDHPAINADQIGIMGHSEGGTIAPQIAVENPDAVAFIISMAGTSIPGDELLLSQNRRIMESQGASEAVIAGLTVHAERSFALAVAQDPALEDAVREQLQFVIDTASEEDLAEIGDVDAFIEQQVETLLEAYNADWYRYLLAYNPGDYWPQVEVPVLGLYGTLDVQVDAGLNVAALEDALSDNPDVEIVIFPTANHLFQDAETGAIEEYGELGNEFLPDFLPTVSAWLLERVTLAGG